MVARTSNQAGDYTVGTNWTPSGAPVVGDIITVDHAMTNFSGVIGDNTASPAITLNTGGSLAASADFNVRTSTGAGILFAGGSLNQNTFVFSFEPSGVAAPLVDFTVTGTNAWNAIGGGVIFDNSQGGSAPIGMNKADGVTYFMNINWTGSFFYEGFGNGFIDIGLYFAQTAQDSFLWRGTGRYIKNGQFTLNGTAQNQFFNIDNISIGAFVGVFGNNASEKAIRTLNLGGNTGHTMTNCLLFDSDTANNVGIDLSVAAGPLDMQGCVFVNFGFVSGPYNTNADDTMFVQTVSGLDDFQIGLEKIAGNPTLSFNRVSAVGQIQQGVHAPVVNGDGTLMVIDDFIADGMNINVNTEVGDQPICNVPVQLNRPVQIWGAGGINPSLNANGQISVSRGTFHRAASALMGEGLNASATLLQSWKSCIFSAPYQGYMLRDGGGNMQLQTQDDVDYNVFIISEMNGTNIAHTTLPSIGYFGQDLGANAGYGVNDFSIANFQFGDPSRHGLTWVASLGYAQTLAGLESAVLANKGVNILGDSVAVDSSTSHAAYRSYIQLGYTSANIAQLSGTGFSGEDIGAYNVGSSTVSASLLSVNNDAFVNISDIPVQTTGIYYWIYSGQDLGNLDILLGSGVDGSSQSNGDITITWPIMNAESSGDPVTIFFSNSTNSNQSAPIFTTID